MGRVGQDTGMGKGTHIMQVVLMANNITSNHNNILSN